MAKKIERLSALAVARATEPGMYADGGGLYLQVTPQRGKSWSFRYMLAGKAREMGLGPFHVINLAEARVRATQCRRMLLDGIDPIEARRAERDRARLEAANSITFRECAAAYIKANKAGWRTEKHADLWTNTLATYAEPIIGALPVQDIDTGLVMRVLEQEVRAASGKAAAPLWTAKPETAGRVRGRMEGGTCLGDGARIPARRKPCPVARPSRQAAAGPIQGGPSRASCCPTLCRNQRFPGLPASRSRASRHGLWNLRS